MIKENQKLFNVVLALADACICVASMCAAFFLRFYVLDGITAVHFDYYMQLMLYVVPVYFVLYAYFHLHDSFRSKALIYEIGQVFKANFVGVLFIFILVFMRKEVDVSRMAIAMFAVVNTLISVLERSLLRTVLRRMRAKGYNLKHLLMVGWTEVSGEFYDRITANRALGYCIDGFVGPKTADLGGRSIKHSGSFSELPALLELRAYDEVVISLEDDEFSLLGDLIEACEKSGTKSSLLPFYTKYLPTRPVIDEVEGLPLINVRRIPLDNFINAFSKRMFDAVCSALGLAVLSPFLLVTAIGVRLSSPGPVIYRQTRIGRNKKKFTMYKFRSMAISSGQNDMTTWGTSGDERRTGFGAFIRKFSIDELPQLFNVLKGNMSLVGPRPERPFFVDRFREEIPLYMVKHLVKPGITGWAQINGWRGDTDIAERVKCDVYYIENWSFLLDIKILCLTFLKGFINKSEE